MEKYRNRILIGIGIALIIYVVLLLILDNEGRFTRDVLAHLQTYPVYVFGLAILAQIAVGFFRFLEWHYYLGVIGARDKISLMDSLVIFVSGFMLTVSPGKMAELLKAVFLKGKTGVPVARSAPVVIAERVIDGMAVIVVLFFAVLIAGDDVDISDYRGLIFASAGILLFGLIAVQIRPLAYFLLGLVEKLPFIQRLHEPLVEFYESSHEIFKLRHVIPTMAMGVGVYLSSAIGFLFIMAGFGLTITWTLFLQALFIVGVTSAIGALSFIPNGAGVTEVSNVVLLIVVVAPSNPLVTEGVAATAALLQGFFHKWFRVLVGMAVAVIFRKRLLSETLEADIAELEAERHPQSVYPVERGNV